MANPYEFHYAFQIDRMTIFEVDYYTLGGNKKPYFATCANRFARSKRGFTECGQCQERLLYGPAKTFYHKWDPMHLKDLTSEQWYELVADIELILKPAYNYELKKRDTFAGMHRSGFSVYELKELSMQEVKNA